MYWKPQATMLTGAFIGIIIIAKVIIIQMMETATPVKLCSCAQDWILSMSFFYSQ